MFKFETGYSLIDRDGFESIENDLTRARHSWTIFETRKMESKNRKITNS